MADLYKILFIKFMANRLLYEMMQIEIIVVCICFLFDFVLFSSDSLEYSLKCTYVNITKIEIWLN